MHAAGFQPSMEANFSDIAKKRRSKGLPAAMPQIFDPQELIDAPAPPRTDGTQEKAPSTPNPACMPLGHSEHLSVPTEVATGAQDAQENAAPASPKAATDEADFKRQRTSAAGASARTKGVLLAPPTVLFHMPCHN
jgi:hypothetical protein